MSLQSNIKKAYEDNIGKEDKFYEALSDAIQSFLKKQRFVVKNLKAYVQIDSIKTDGDIPVDIKETTILGQYAPLIDALEKIGGTINRLGSFANMGSIGDPILKPIDQMKSIAKVISKEGATQKKHDLDKDGAVGGTMTGIGHAYIGPESHGMPGADTTEELADYVEIFWDGNELT